MGINLPCVLVLGGSFDPVHTGHTELARHFVALLQPQQLRVIPTGQPWQKSGLIATPDQRVAMLELAFADVTTIPVVVDQQEIQRADQGQASYSIDTLRNLRHECDQEFGQECSIVFLMGADQLQNLPSWRDWQNLFHFAHICVASRPGTDLQHLPSALDTVWQERSGTPEQILQKPAGYCYLDTHLAQEISATEIRRELKQANQTTVSVPPKVLDYIQQHHLYR